MELSSLDPSVVQWENSEDSLRMTVDARNSGHSESRQHFLNAGRRIQSTGMTEKKLVKLIEQIEKV